MKAVRGFLPALGLAGWLGLSCAAIQPPSGGPVDTTPPVFLGAEPPGETVHFSGGPIRLRFSEYMDETSIERGIRITPRLGTEPQTRFRGGEIVLTLPPDLQPNQTYVITLGRELKDEHGVGLAEPVQLAYSTGGQIDQGSIAGQIRGEGRYSVHLWRLDPGVEMDSIFALAPLYVTEVTDQGNYRFQYLRPGHYQVLALETQAAGLALQPARMAYGVHWRNQLRIDSTETREGINMLVWKEPQPLRLLRGEWGSSRWGWLIFNTPLEPGTSFPALTVRDAVGGEQSLGTFIDPRDRTRLLVVAPDSLEGTRLGIHLGPVSLNGKTLLDSARLEVRVQDEADTSYLALEQPTGSLSITPERGNLPRLRLVFSKPLQAGQFEPHLTLLDADSDTVALGLENDNPLVIELENRAGWRSRQTYRLVLPRESFVALDGTSFQDSVVSVALQTTNRLGYGGLLGSLVGVSRSSLMSRLTALENPTLSYGYFVNSKLNFKFTEIPEGHYSLMIFEDRDSNGEYSYGKAFPFQPSEWFTDYPDTIEVRANWDIELAPFSIPEVH